MSDGFVYFIQEEETGRIKIGFSEKHPLGRLKDFQTGNSNKLILLGYIEGTQQDESNLHREFYEERIRNENEWFKYSVFPYPPKPSTNITFSARYFDRYISKLFSFKSDIFYTAVQPPSTMIVAPVI